MEPSQCSLKLTTLTPSILTGPGIYLIRSAALSSVYMTPNV